MRSTLTAIAIILTCAYAFGQGKVKIIDYYESKVKSGPFFMRWYWALRGGSPYVWKASLQLKSDSSFIYSYRGGDCGTFDHSGSGTWRKKEKELLLQSCDNCYMLENVYIIEKGRLYASRDSLTNRTVAFKKK